MCPPFSLYLAALFSRFTTTCSSRVGSASSPQVAAVERDVELVLPLLDERPGRGGGRSRMRRQVDDFSPELDLAR